ncbi:MAG TPA: hypothetical protein PKZ12_07880, partial [Smithellaceae bacterium]|nr:hypothetical protein [Smithellaceae bacterium]
MKPFMLTPAAGKRLIGKALAAHPAIVKAIKSNTVAIIAGTTNGYIAEEFLQAIGVTTGFSKRRFFRGIVMPPSRPTREDGRYPDESEFPGDVIITKGKWQKGKTIFDVVDNMREGDIILKGANALDLAGKRAAIYIGNAKGGTIGVSLPAVIGRRVRLIIPVGLEKRISGNLDDLASKLNAPGRKGPRFWPVPGEVFTEIDAIATLTGAKAELVAAGGVGGAEGCIWLLASGNAAQLKKAEKIIRKIIPEEAKLG